LAGSGSPHTDPAASGAFLGLRTSHRLGHLVRAVLEGTAYEIELVRQRAALLGCSPGARLVATGGGVRNASWMQIKADVHGCPIELARTPEAVLLGAALVAGLGAGIFADSDAASRSGALAPEMVYQPNDARHAAYKLVYTQRFLPLQDLIRHFRPVEPGRINESGFAPEIHTKDQNG
jgi:xylulokinase